MDLLGCCGWLRLRRRLGFGTRRQENRHVIVTDVHEQRLEVKDENLGTHSTGGYLGGTGSQSRSQLGGQSPRYRLTSQRGRQSELYLPGLVPVRARTR